MLSSRKKVSIAVIGTSQPDENLSRIAEEVGREIALRGCILICGGLGGVMEYAARAAKENKGLTVGILPSEDISSANPYIDIPIATGMGEARNIIIVKSSDALIAIGKGYGTLSEISFALKLRKPIIGIKTWDISSQIICVEEPDKAVQRAISLVRTNITS
jgi:uncharacterized protein (TIGR00725 family)